MYVCTIVFVRFCKLIIDAINLCRLDYEVVELTWENGQLAMHRLDPPRGPVKPIPSTTSLIKYNTWDEPRASGTLESIVNHATLIPHQHHRNHNSNNPRLSLRSNSNSTAPDVPMYSLSLSLSI